MSFSCGKPDLEIRVGQNGPWAKEKIRTPCGIRIFDPRIGFEPAGGPTAADFTRWRAKRPLVPGTLEIEKVRTPYGIRTFGPSDWIRTSGLLNPIQARYQTSPHPDVYLSPRGALPKRLDYITTPLRRMQAFFEKFLKLFLAPQNGAPLPFIPGLQTTHTTG